MRSAVCGRKAICVSLYVVLVVKVVVKSSKVLKV